MKSIVSILIAFLFFCPVVLADTATQSIITTDNAILADSFRVIWGLLVVLGIMLLLYGLLRKRFSLLSSHPDKEINIIEIKPLMGKKAICLVEVRGREYLLGISDSHISNIATLPEKKTQSFSDTLKQQSGSKDE